MENVWYNCGKLVFQKKYHKPNLFQSLEKLEVWKLFGKHLESLFGNRLEFTCEFLLATLEFVWKYHNGNLEFNRSFYENLEDGVRNFLCNSNGRLMDFLWNNHGSAFQVARVVICKKLVII